MNALGKLAAGVSLALLACAAHSAPRAGLDIDLQAGTTKSDSGYGTVRYTLTNTTARTMLVLAWETPLRGVGGDLFDVRMNGRPVAYVGREYKRGLPQPEDYIEIKAGESLSVDVDLAAYYDMGARGDYAVQAHGHFHDRFSLKAGRGGSEAALPISDRDVVSPTVHVWFDGVQLPYLREPQGVFGITKAGSVSFVGCTSTRQSQINSGLSAARSMASDSSSYLAANRTGPRWTTWFGNYNATNYSKVRTNFTKIGDALNNQPLVFDCSCTDSAYAYVYPTQPYRIYLCNAYWPAPVSGTDSKGGTTVHEVSHFNVVADTDDLAYGQAACKKLAKQPSKATRNADSHEYFAENTPALN